jgi:hypothetical protein
MLLLVTNCGFQGRVGEHIVVINEPVVVVPSFLLRSPGKLRNSSKRCLRALGLFNDGLRGRVLKFYQHFLLFC